MNTINDNIRGICRVIGLTDDQTKLIDAAHRGTQSIDGYYIPHTPKWQRIAKELVLDGYLDRDHNIDDTDDIAVRFTADNAQNMVNTARSLRW